MEAFKVKLTSKVLLRRLTCLRAFTGDATAMSNTRHCGVGGRDRLFAAVLLLEDLVAGS